MNLALPKCTNMNVKFDMAALKMKKFLKVMCRPSMAMTRSSVPTVLMYYQPSEKVIYIDIISV